MPFRIGSGIGPTAEAAAFLAMAEAMERYALQYAPARPPFVEPFLAAGGPADPAPLAALTLGAPGSGNINSRGGATGVGRGDAAARALHELLEHHHVCEDGRLVGPFHAVAPETFGGLVPHIAFLADQLRKLDIAVMVSPMGYAVARTLCRDADGGRRTMGSAAGPDIEGTVRRAAEEAMLLWRNMVELEARSASIPACGTPQGNIVRIYRGAAPFSCFLPQASLSKPPTVPVANAPLEQVVHTVLGRRVRVFDLAVPSIDVAVVRAYLD